LIEWKIAPLMRIGVDCLRDREIFERAGAAIGFILV
jgi:hypothetical protein